jgi:hypothetical protein
MKMKYRGGGAGGGGVKENAAEKRVEETVALTRRCLVE